MELQDYDMRSLKTGIDRLDKPIGGNVLFVKRDDLIPFSFGGNKARKAFYFFKEILDGEYDTVVTYGAGSSNHCRVVANMSAKYGLPCYIVSPEENYQNTFNSRLVGLFGAKIIKTPVDNVSACIDTLIRTLESEGKRPYFIAGGGHGNLGTQAYVDAYSEIKAFEEESGVKFDCIFHASGTGTTQAGLVCGAALCGDTDKKIVGISIARKCPRGRDVVVKSIDDYLQSIDYKGAIPDITFDDSYVLDGYGRYNDDIVSVAREVMTNAGIPLNTTYTAKAFWGMKQYLERNKICGKNILFINTGGAPLFFDDMIGDDI